MSPRLLLLVAGIAVALWAMSRWRLAIQAVMVWLVLEGAVRKWIFPGSQDLIYFAKDVILIAAYAGFLRHKAALRYRAPSAPLLTGGILLAVGWGAFEIFNPNLPNLLVGVLGFKAYFLYVPLMYILPAVFRTDEELVGFLRRYCLLAIPQGLLATLQFMSPASSALNAYARSSDVGYVATFGSSTYVRVTGTFSFITGLSSYLVATTVLILLVLAVYNWRFRGNLLLYLSLALAAVGMLMSGSRGPVVTVAMLFPLYWWLTVGRERGGSRTLGRLLIGLSLVGGLVVWLGGEAWTAFVGRASAASDFASRITSPLLSPYYLLSDAGLFGFGIGASHQMAAAVTTDLIPYSWLRGLHVEAETGKVMLELGSLGFLLVYFVRLALVFYAFRQVLRLRTRLHRAVATAGLLFCLAVLPGGSIFDVTSGLYSWFFAGLVMVAVRLDQKAVAAARVAAAVPPPRLAQVPA
jgi:hypothetical protein